jgi:hypothetical protein
MKKILSMLFVISCIHATAQDDDCIDRQLAKIGKWTKLKETVKSSSGDMAIQRRFYNAVHNHLQAGYQPKGLDAAYSGSFQPPQYSQRLAYCWYTIFAERYFCEGDALVLNKFDINTIFTTEFNYVSFLEIYDTTAADNPLGFRPLREGFPVEIRPGIWQFNDVKTSLGAGNEGLTKLWLITYDGQLPWSFVTRREFLLKRKRFLQKEMAKEAQRLKDQLAGWEQQKKYKEQELKSDPVRLASYISGTHNPGIEREQANYKKLMQGYENAFEKLDEQLSAPAEDLSKWAIVIKSTQNNFDYFFTDKMEPFAELLTKPNPAYFKKWSSPAVPQMITVSIKHDLKNPVSVGFAREMEKLLNLDLLKSFIGKTAPSTGSNTAQSGINSNLNNTTSTSTKPSTNSNTKTVANNSSTEPGQPTSVQTSPGKNIFLSGTLSAPAGVPITIGYNNRNDLTITPPKGAGNLYNTTPIKFAKPVKENEEYTVSIKKIASNMKGVVYQGKGKAPDDAGKIKIGVDYTCELVTRSSDDNVFPSFYESFAPAVGGYNGEEGRYVVFVSNTKGFGGADGKFRQVFWRDRNTGVTKMISVSSTGEQGNGDCNEPSISVDGKIVVFESKANNLVSGDNNNFKDVFLWRAATNTIELISKSINGGGADSDCFDAAISGNGNFVAFTSSANNLSPVPKGRSLANIFLRDAVAGKTEMISVDPVQKAGGNGYKASISFDGSRISFCSPSNTLVANDNNGFWDIFLWQRGQSSLKRISMTHDGKERNGGTESASRQVASVISGNGRYVAFATTASNMVPDDDNKFQDVFVVDVETGKVAVASFTNEGLPSNGDSPIEQGERVAISFDGTWVTFPTKATNLGTQSSNLILYNTKTGKSGAVTNTRGSYVGRPSISYSGAYILFGKSEPMDQRLGVAFGNNGGGIFAHFTGNGPCRDCKD